MLIAASDVVDFQSAVSANADVATSTALRHARLHSLMSTADHSDVSGTPTTDQVLAYDSDDTWKPATLTAVAHGGTW